MLISDDAALMTARKSSCPAIARKIDRICAISIERGSLLMAPYPPPTLQRFPFIWDHPVPYERKRRRLHCLAHVPVGEPDYPAPGHAIAYFARLKRRNPCGVAGTRKNGPHSTMSIAIVVWNIPSRPQEPKW